MTTLMDHIVESLSEYEVAEQSIQIRASSPEFNITPSYDRAHLLVYQMLLLMPANTPAGHVVVVGQLVLKATYYGPSTATNICLCN